MAYIDRKIRPWTVCKLVLAVGEKIEVTSDEKTRLLHPKKFNDANDHFKNNLRSPCESLVETYTDVASVLGITTNQLYGVRGKNGHVRNGFPYIFDKEDFVRVFHCVKNDESVQENVFGAKSIGRYLDTDHKRSEAVRNIIKTLEQGPDHEYHVPEGYKLVMPTKLKKKCVEMKTRAASETVDEDEYNEFIDLLSEYIDRDNPSKDDLERVDNAETIEAGEQSADRPTCPAERHPPGDSLRQAPEQDNPHTDVLGNSGMPPQVSMELLRYLGRQTTTHNTWEKIRQRLGLNEYESEIARNLVSSVNAHYPAKILDLENDTVVPFKDRYFAELNSIYLDCEQNRLVMITATLAFLELNGVRTAGTRQLLETIREAGFSTRKDPRQADTWWAQLLQQLDSLFRYTDHPESSELDAPQPDARAPQDMPPTRKSAIDIMVTDQRCRPASRFEATCDNLEAVLEDFLTYPTQRVAGNVWRIATDIPLTIELERSYPHGHSIRFSYDTGISAEGPCISEIDKLILLINSTAELGRFVLHERGETIRFEFSMPASSLADLESSYPCDLFADYDAIYPDEFIYQTALYGGRNDTFVYRCARSFERVSKGEATAEESHVLPDGADVLLFHESHAQYNGCLRTDILGDFPTLYGHCSTYLKGCIECWLMIILPGLRVARGMRGQFLDMVAQRIDDSRESWLSPWRQMRINLYDDSVRLEVAIPDASADVAWECRETAVWLVEQCYGEIITWPSVVFEGQ